MTPIAPLITSFLREHMPTEQGCSPQTCETYAHAFRLLFIFASARLENKPSQICLEQIDAPLILDFLAHIEAQRSNCAATRNGRLAAVKAFIRYVEFRVPSALAQARQIHAIPTNATTRRWCVTSRWKRCAPSSTHQHQNAPRYPGPRHAAPLFRRRAARLGTGGAPAGESVSATELRASVFLARAERSDVFRSGRKPRPTCVRGWRFGEPSRARVVRQRRRSRDDAGGVRVHPR